MSIFGDKQHLTISELRQLLIKASPSIPGSSRMFSSQERLELFGKGWGSYVTKNEFNKRLLQLRGEKFRAKTSADRIKIDRQMRYMKKLA